MSKEIDLIKCIISEIDKNLYSDFGGNPCISYTTNLKKLLLELDTPEVRHLFENCNNQDQRIAELEEQLAEKEKEIVALNNRILIPQLQAPKEQILNILNSQCVQYNPDQHIADLETQLAEMNKKALALFGVLYEIIEKEDPENVSSKIDYLTRQNNSALSDAYKEEKFLKGIKK